MDSNHHVPTVGPNTTSTSTRTMTQPGVDEEDHQHHHDHRYRTEVLQLPSQESEVARAHRLEEEAHRIGLKVPEIEMAASLPSISSGLVEISSSSPVLSSGSSTCEGTATTGGSSSTTAACGVAAIPTGVPSAAPAAVPAAAAGAETANSAPSGSGGHDAVSPLEQVSSSLSELTGTASPSSRALKSGSVRSLASFSTRPASYCSNDGKWIYGYGAVNEKKPTSSDPTKLLQPPQQHQRRLPQQQQQQQQQQQRAFNRHSMMSVVSGENSNYNNNKKSKRRTSIMAAFGKIPFRRKRASSASGLLSPEVQVTVTKGEQGEDKMFVESKPGTPTNEHGPGNDSTTANSNRNSMVRLEIPVFDHESLQRSLVNPELVKMREAQWLERNRHMAFQEAFMSRLRCRQQAAVADRLAENKRLEDEKREQISKNVARMEERQLAVEIEQQREFERAKQNVRTRIKHMEGYLNTRSPPSSPSSSGTDALAHTHTHNHTHQSQPRQYTDQQKAQLAQEYHNYKSMDQLHESKIKVLRERQERRLFEASERMDTEMDDLIDKHAEGFADLQKQHQEEEAAHQQAFEAKKTKLRRRWNLEEAIQRRKLELQHEVPFGPLPPLTFTDSHYDTRDSAICVSDSTCEDGHHHQHKQQQQQLQQRGEGAMF